MLDANQSGNAEAEAEEDSEEVVDGMDEDEESDEGEEEEERLLDSFSSQPELSSVLEALQQQASDSSVFLQPSEQLSLAARETARVSLRGWESRRCPCTSNACDEIDA